MVAGGASATSGGVVGRRHLRAIGAVSATGRGGPPSGPLVLARTRLSLRQACLYDPSCRPLLRLRFGSPVDVSCHRPLALRRLGVGALARLAVGRRAEGGHRQQPECHGKDIPAVFHVRTPDSAGRRLAWGSAARPRPRGAFPDPRPGKAKRNSARVSHLPCSASTNRPSAVVTQRAGFFRRGQTWLGKGPQPSLPSLTKKAGPTGARPCCLPFGPSAGAGRDER